MCSRSPQPLVLPPAHHLSTAWEIREEGKETGKRKGREEMEDFLRSPNKVGDPGKAGVTVLVES